MNVITSRRDMKCVYVAAAIAWLAPMVHAEPTLEEVIVTAQKREQNQQDIPISLTAFTADVLERQGITNVTHLANKVPNLRLIPFGQSPETPNIFIRGVGSDDNQVTQDAPVAIYLNGVYIAREVGLALDIPDLERVEVLRGPQGTLYGRNTTGGAINFITAKPSNEFGASQLLSFGNYGAVHTATVLNLPVTDTFYVRGSFDWNKRDGWVENSGVGRDFSAYDHYAGRIDMRWKPSDALTVDYSYDRSKSDYTSNYYQLVRPSPGFSFLPAQPNRVTSATLTNPFKGGTNVNSGHTLTVALETGIGEFKSISAYRDVNGSTYADFSANPIQGIFHVDPYILMEHQISQEFQLLGSNEARTLDYIAGLYYFKERATQYERDVVDVAGPGVFGFANAIALNRTYAAYGQITWRPDAASAWSYTVGGRYTKDKREVSGVDAAGPSGSTEYSNFSPTGIVNYKITEDANLYGKIVLGYRAGGFNIRQQDFVTFPFGPEKVTTYELGWKTEWLARRLRWNTALFYSDYKDMQLTIIVPGQPDPTFTRKINAGKAKIAGVETELNLAVTDNLRAQLAYGYLYSKVEKVINDDASQYRLQNAPKNSATATLDWDIAHLPFGTLNTTVDYNWRDNSQTAARASFGNGDLVNAYAVADLTVSLAGADWIGRGTDCRVSLWVRNLADTEYLADPIGGFNGLHALQISDFGLPRTYGVDFKVKY